MFSLKDFRFIKMIGAGTFGRVYLVQIIHKDIPADRYYALKILRLNSMVKLRQMAHIKNERDILVECRGNPFIVKLMVTFVTEDHFCYLMEYVSGGELFSWLKKMRKLNSSSVRFYAAQIILALEELHSKKIIFRDLKPENVLLNKDGYIKLTDFGFAKKIEKVTYTVCGTPEYMAPEELEGEGHGKEVDFWSLGILIFEMAVGIPPFYDPSCNNTIYEKICNEDPLIPSYLDPLLQDLIEKLLIKERTIRIGGIRGIVEIKEHPFFEKFDWNALIRKELHPPIVPQVRFNGDTSNFIEYDVENDQDRKYINPLTHFRFF